MEWLPDRRYCIPGRILHTGQGNFSFCSGTIVTCREGSFNGFADVPDTLTRGPRSQHADNARQFALEIAQLDLQARMAKVPLSTLLHQQFPQWTVPPRPQIPLQATVDFTDPPQVFRDLSPLGMTWLKVKLTGQESLQSLRDFLRQLKGFRVRLDVNAGWQHRADLPELLELCAAMNVAYVEDPVLPQQFPRNPPLPLAIDALDSTPELAMQLVLEGRAQVLVVKPHLWGSLAHLLQDLQQLADRQLPFVLSSALDGPVGLAQLAQLAAVVPGALQPAGIATDLRWDPPFQLARAPIKQGHWHLIEVTPPQPPEILPLIEVKLAQIQTFTPDQLHELTRRVALHLRHAGVQPGARVALWSENHGLLLAFIDALRHLQAIFVPLHPRLTAIEVTGLLERVKPQLLATDKKPLNLQMIPQMQLDELQQEIVGKIPQLPPGNGEEIAAILFTSGSSGQPKGVQLSRRALLAAAQAAEQQLGSQMGAKWLCCLPICHVSGLMILERARLLQMTVVLLNQPSTAELAAAMAVHQPEWLSLVPTQLTRLLDEKCSPHPGLQGVIVGGAPCPPELLDRAHRAGWPVLPSYGMTETCAQVATAPLEFRLSQDPWPRSENEVCVGPPLPGVEVRIDSGEILLRSPQLLSAWLDEPALQDGWLRTGDLGRMDARGWLWLQGRRGELIVRGGENVTPDEIQGVLMQIPGVLEVCVVGIPHPILGQQVAAWLTVERQIPADELQNTLAQLAKFKHPQVWLQTPEPLPRTGPGKIARGQVRDRLGRLA